MEGGKVDGLQQTGDYLRVSQAFSMFESRGCLVSQPVQFALPSLCLLWIDLLRLDVGSVVGAAVKHF